MEVVGKEAADTCWDLRSLPSNVTVYGKKAFQQGSLRFSILDVALRSSRRESTD